MSSGGGLSQDRDNESGRCMRMDKVLWNTMMSLDGFIAGPNDDMQWVFGVDGGAGQTSDDVVGSTRALLVGRRT